MNRTITTILALVALVALAHGADKTTDASSTATVTACGTSPDIGKYHTFASVVTVGSGSAVSCTISFVGSVWPRPETCVVTGRSRTDLTYTLTADALIVANSAGANMAGTRFDYRCDFGPA